MQRRKNSYKKINSINPSFSLILGSLLVLVIIAQILFNIFVWQELQRNTVFNLRSSLIEAMRGLDEMRKSPEDGRRIPEASIILPEETDEVQSIRYIYNDPIDSMPPLLEITTKELSKTIMKIYGTSVENLFEQVPEAQACSRGFSIVFGEPAPNQLSSSSFIFVSKKRLADGREVQLWRDRACGEADSWESVKQERHSMMNDLEKHLLQIDSY